MEKFATTPSLDQLLAIKAEELTTLIDAGVVIEGVLRVTNGKSVLVSGEIKGAIEANGSVVINEGACILGSIRAKSLQVSGHVKASKDTDIMDIDGPIVLTKTAVIACDAVSEGVQTEFGAVMNGRFRPREEKSLSQIPPILRPRPQVPGASILQAVTPSHLEPASAMTDAQDRHVG